MKDIYKHLPPVPPQILLSIEPMFRLLREEQLQDTEHAIAHLALTISVPRKSIYRWMQEGITLYHAENLSAKLGLHPAYIWGPEYHIAVYMNEHREKFVDNLRSKRASIRRTIKRENLRKELQSGKQSAKTGS